MKTLRFLIFAALMLGIGVACSNNDEGTQVTAVTPSAIQRYTLDNTFSDGNGFFRNQPNEDMLIVINNAQDMLELRPSSFANVWIDWNIYSIIGGRIITPSFSDKILSHKLVGYPDASLYRYEITVKKSTESGIAKGVHYFWRIYAQKWNPEDVSLIVKIVE
jgi:hypothetical protein